MAYHTYEFLKKRRNDPKWREAYISARNKRILLFLVAGNLFFWGALLWRYIEQHDIDVAIYIDEFKQKIAELIE